MAREQETSKGLFAIETLRSRFGTPMSVYYGMVAMKGWNAGKQVTEDEYKQALSEFNKSGTGKGAE